MNYGRPIYIAKIQIPFFHSTTPNNMIELELVRLKEHNIHESDSPVKVLYRLSNPVVTDR